MKIALLNMMFDNNYGGNLQRYAMVTTLQRMGHEVEYLYIRSEWREDWMRSGNVVKRAYRFFRQVLLHILHPKREPWLAWVREGDFYRAVCAKAEPFLDKYIPHTEVIRSHKQLASVVGKRNYDSVIAGSDQIWRKKYVERYGLGTWFLDFVPKDYKGKRIIYGASFGVDGKEYTPDEVDKIRELYNKLDAVSLREKGGFNLLKEYGWTKPIAQLVLDPTLLLSCADYERLIDTAETHKPEGNMFCYIMDDSEENMSRIKRIAEENGLTPNIMYIYGDNDCSIEQWLRNIRDAKFVYTDSYHGFLFSVIFEKPYYVSINVNRGASRFLSVTEMLGIELEKEPNRKMFDKRLNDLRKGSIEYITKALQ